MILLQSKNALKCIVVTFLCYTFVIDQQQHSTAAAASQQHHQQQRKLVKNRRLVSPNIIPMYLENELFFAKNRRHLSVTTPSASPSQSTSTSPSSTSSTSPSNMPSQSATSTAPPTDTPTTYVPTFAPTDSEAPSESPSDMPSSAPTVELSDAIFYPPAGVPFCQEVLAGCDSGALLYGRGSMTNGAESNAPNTLDGCQDGSDGTYYSDESVERIKIVSVGNGVLRKGTTVEVQATVYAYDDGSSDTADFYFIADATNSSLSWQYIGSVVPLGGGLQTLTQQYVLPTGSGNDIQAVRVNFRYNGSVGTCTSGDYNDRDDLAFAVADSLPLSTEENEYGAHGVMFDVFAEHKLRIDSFDVFSAYNQTNSTVKLYTRPGRYSGFEVSSEGWELVQDDYVDFLGQDLPTTILVDVTIPAASFQSFLIWSPDEKVMYNIGTSEGSLYAANDYLQFYEGIGVTNIFSNDTEDIYSPRVLRGAIGHNLEYTEMPSSSPSSSPSSQPSVSPSAQPSSSPSSFPSSSPSYSPSAQPSAEPTSTPSTSPSAQPSSFPSSTPSMMPSSSPTSMPSSQPSWDPLDFSVDENEFGSFGGMFTVKANAKISVISFGIYTETVSTNQIQVYTRPGFYYGFEVNATGWTLVFDDVSVNLLGQDNETHIDIADVTIKQDDYQSFFIWSPSVDIMYNLGTSEGALYSSNDYASFYEGVGVEAKFSGDYNDTYAPRVLRGSLRYEVEETSMPSQAPSSIWPSSSPSVMPSSVPSQQPSNQPSTFPSVEPSYSPSSVPSSSPSWEGLLLSTADNELGGNGAMFYIYAPTGKIKINYIGCYTEMVSSNQTVEIYTRVGKYEGFEVNATGWELAYSHSLLDFQGPDTLTQFSDIDVDVKAGTYQSFFIWSPNVQIMYDSGTLEGSLHSSNAYVEFYEGVGIVSKFSGDPDDVKSPRILKGMIGFEVLPTSEPSASPSMLPSAQPSAQPTSTPSTEPSSQPSSSPSNHPSSEPSSSPSSGPSSNPSSFPSSSPSSHPSSEPSSSPSSHPSLNPSSFPSSSPSSHPSSEPSSSPSSQPSLNSSSHPSSSPSSHPSLEPSSSPSSQPSSNPSSFPSSSPSIHPSSEPSSSPSSGPSLNPSSHPSSSPSSHPSSEPSRSPSSHPSSNPSSQPSVQPSSMPTSNPSSMPSVQPSMKPSSRPSDLPSLHPSNEPTSKPSINPSSQPTSSPSSSPSLHPSSEPTAHPSPNPSAAPSADPTVPPTPKPTPLPTLSPTTLQPTQSPSANSLAPTQSPSSQSPTTGIVPPTDSFLDFPTASPSSSPTSRDATPSPTSSPSTKQPTKTPTKFPTSSPTVLEEGGLVEVSFTAAMSLVGIDASDVDAATLDSLVEMLQTIIKAMLPDGASVRITNVAGFQLPSQRRLQDVTSSLDVEMEVVFAESCESTAACDLSKETLLNEADAFSSELKTLFEDGSMSTSITEYAAGQENEALKSISVDAASLQVSELKSTLTLSSELDVVDDDDSAATLMQGLPLFYAAAIAVLLGAAL